MTVIRTKKSLRGALLAGGLAAAALGGGCAEDPCDQLLDICIRCTDSTTRRQCTFSVQADMSESCEYQIDYYTAICP